MTCKSTLFKSILCISLLLPIQLGWAAPKNDPEPKDVVDCSDPAYSYLPSCGVGESPQGLSPPDIYNRGTPGFSSGEPPELQNKRDAIGERNSEKKLEKMRLACEKKTTPAQREKCLERLDY